MAAFPAWLEITALISALRAGSVQPPTDGVTPALTPQQLKSGGVIHVAKDALFSFCMTASLKGDKDAIEAVEEQRDEKGNVTVWPVAAREAGNRFGIRPDQLAMFLIAAQEARIAVIEVGS